MLTRSKYFKTFDGCAILCFDFEFYYEIMRQMHEDQDRKGILGSFAMQNRLFGLIAQWKERLGSDMETVLASRIGGDGAFAIFKGAGISRNLQRALCCARELRDCYMDVHSPDDELSPEYMRRLRREFLHIGIHAGRVYRHDSPLIPLPSNEAKYNFVSHDMHLCSRIMRFMMNEKFDAVVSEQAWAYVEEFLIDNIKFIRANKKTMPVAPNVTMSLYGVNLDILDWDKVTA